MAIKLNQMKLMNFQGIRNLELNFNGLDKSIRGDNGTGKTTIINAYYYLLTDKPSVAMADYSPKTKGIEGDLHNLEHTVECTFDIDGIIKVLKKTYKEKWTQKRGNKNKELTGNTISYEVDGLPVKEKDYNREIEDLFGPREVIQILISPTYFGDILAWKERRRYLTDICGDYTDEEIIDTVEDLKPLDEILMLNGSATQKRSIDDHVKLLKTNMSNINKELKQIPSRIDEAERAIPETAGSKTDYESRLFEARKEISSLNDRKLAAKSGNSVAVEKSNRIAEIKQKEREARIAHVNSFDEVNRVINKTVNDLTNQKNLISDTIGSNDIRISRLKSDVDYMSNERNKLLNEYKNVSVSEFDESKTVCESCGQSLPMEQQEKKREEFNIKKSKKLEKLKARGVEVGKEKIAAKQLELDNLVKENEQLGIEVMNIATQIEIEKSKIVAVTLFEDTEEYRNIKKQLADLENVDCEIYKVIEGIDQEIHECNIRIADLNTHISRFQLAEDQQKRIEELEARQAQLAEDYDRYEYELSLCEKFIVEKVSRITEKINNRFKTVNFELFEKQITNDAIVECCNVLVPNEKSMVPYKMANNASRINAGIEIIDTLSEHFGIRMPIFVDNAESVTRITSTDNQLIRLVVDEDYKNLTMMEE
ncbi:AAA family ATPase [Thomasclavelia cocleata]|uniref:AAA family ATPase n=1 Tax=Thomasclavelia cocleata TaxID=69824 RepID=UPI0025582E53|nr:AAA family ATPase [Thomasclavelia cocleata]